MAKIQKQEKKEITKYYLSILGEEREVTEEEYYYFQYRFGSINQNSIFDSIYIKGKITKEKDSSFSPYSILVETEEEHRFLKGLFDGFPDNRKDVCENFSITLDTIFSNLLYDQDN